MGSKELFNENTSLLKEFSAVKGKVVEQQQKQSLHTCLQRRKVFNNLLTEIFKLFPGFPSTFPLLNTRVPQLLPSVPSNLYTELWKEMNRGISVTAVSGFDSRKRKDLRSSYHIQIGSGAHPTGTGDSLIAVGT
jgi:hypothetical protein